MTPQDVGKLCCKMLGIYALIMAVTLSEGLFLSFVVAGQASALGRVALFVPVLLLL